MATHLCRRFQLSKNILCGKRNNSGLYLIRQSSVSTHKQPRKDCTILGENWRSRKGLNDTPRFCKWLGIFSKIPLQNYPQARHFSPKPDHTSPGHDPVHVSAASVVQRLHELEEAMRVKGYNVLRWGLAAIAVLLATVYLFREEVRENVADEVAGVASRSLGDENVVNKANEITKIVLQDIIHDPETSRLASEFITSVLNREDLRTSAVNLTLYVLRDPSTNQKVSELAASTLRDLLKREDMKSLLLGYIKELVVDESTKAACTHMIKDLLEDPKLKAFMAESLANLVASSIVTTKAVELGKNVTHEVVSDTVIQKETGDALWKVLKDSVTPSWFSNKPH